MEQQSCRYELQKKIEPTFPDYQTLHATTKSPNAFQVVVQFILVFGRFVYPFVHINTQTHTYTNIHTSIFALSEASSEFSRQSMLKT